MLELPLDNPTPIADAIHASIVDALKTVPEGSKGALLLRADLDGNAFAHVAWKFDDHWKVAISGGINIKEKRPAGSIAVEAVW